MGRKRRMREEHYSADKSMKCRYCYFWDRRTKGCKRGEGQCYYNRHEEKTDTESLPCEGCPYGRVNPCIGFCLRKLMKK